MGKHREKQAKGSDRFPDYPRKGFKQSFARFKKATCPGWGELARSVVDECIEKRGWDATGLSEEPCLRGVRLHLDDLSLYQKERRSLKKKMADVWLPDLMDLWERMPLVVRFSKQAVDAAATVDTALFDERAANRAFPHAVFLDLSEAASSYDDLPEGVFAWPLGSKDIGPISRFIRFPDASVGLCTGLVDIANADTRSDYAAKARTVLMCKNIKAKGTGHDKRERPIMDQSFERSLLGSGFESVEDAWDRLLSTNKSNRTVCETEPLVDNLTRYRSFTELLPSGMGATSFSDRKDGIANLEELAFSLMASAFGELAGFNVRSQKEGGVEVLVVRTAAEASMLKKQEQLKIRVQRAAEGRQDAVKMLAQARSEVSELRRQLNVLAGEMHVKEACGKDFADVDDAEAIEGEAKAAGADLDRIRAAWESRISDAEKALANEKLKSQAAEARAQVAETAAAALAARASLIDEMTLPLTCASAAELAQRAWPDKLLLLPSAFKSAAQFNARRADEVFDVLRACALHLHRLAFAEESVDLTRAFQAASGYEVALRDVKLVRQSARLKKARTFIYRNHKVEMIPHVKGASSKPGECLRVHFYLDHERKLVVIGYCGEHLTGEVSPN